ncbi:MAG: helix-turn-helix domain-containing protein [Chloroflexia bacterium]|nr:helix-turn-helix domain-containing protein [Chloroflexia bacterium]
MDLLTVKETAALLKVSPLTVRRYIAAGRLSAVRFGRRIRVQREAVEGLIEPVTPTRDYFGLSSLKGRPTFDGDPLWNIIGMAETDEPTDVAEHKDDYLAAAAEGRRR